MGSLASDNTGIAPSSKRSGYPASLEQAGIEGKTELRSHMQRKLREENKEERNILLQKVSPSKMRQYLKIGAAEERLEFHVERPCAGVKESSPERTWKEDDKGW